jgi:hypothetical protein
MPFGWGPKGRRFKSGRPDYVKARFGSGLSAFRAPGREPERGAVVPALVPSEISIGLGSKGHWFHIRPPPTIGKPGLQAALATAGSHGAIETAVVPDQRRPTCRRRAGSVGPARSVSSGWRLGPPTTAARLAVECFRAARIRHAGDLLGGRQGGMREADEPLTTAAVTDIALRRGLLTTTGKTPVASMSAALYAAPSGSGIRREFEPGRRLIFLDRGEGGPKLGIFSPRLVARMRHRV